MGAIGDIDGVPDFAVGAPQASVTDPISGVSKANAGRIYVYSGKTGRLLYKPIARDPRWWVRPYSLLIARRKRVGRSYFGDGVLGTGRHPTCRTRLRSLLPPASTP